ncbi:MAG: acyltransferase [Kiritimatiellae bacterium]|nr:acyltransferase [Kiritimatiellia bacterium]
MTTLARFWNFLSAQGACEKRVISFDILRTTAFVGVLIQHSYACFTRQFGLKEWMHGYMLGRFGVSLFIILSGASLALGSLKSGYFTFLRKRAASILPFYWVAYVVVGAFLFMIFGRICMRGDIPKILMTVFALDGYIPIKGRYYLIGEWFTGFILIMYLLAPVVHWSILRTRGLILPLYFVISVLAVNYTPVLSQSVVIWHSHANFNVLSRILEFALGIFFTLYVLRRRKLHALLAAIGGGYIIVFTALGHDVLEFTTTGFLSIFCIFLILTYLLSFVPLAESQRSIISFFAKYSFMAFLFHHQVLFVMKEKLTLRCAPEYVVFMVVSSFMLSYLLAYVFYRPAECLKRAVFGPYNER